MNGMDGMSLYFQLTASLPRLKSRVRIPCPAFNINNFAAIIHGLTAKYRIKLIHKG
jgi:hypothetical protein